VTYQPPKRRRHDAPPTEAHQDDEQRWANLAHLALIISRKIQYDGNRDSRAASLTQSEAVVLCYLLHEDPATPSRIAYATGLLRPNVSASLRTLKNKGLIEKRINPTDGRGFTVHPTTLGRAAHERVRHEWATSVAAAADRDTTGLDAAIAVLNKVKEGLEKQPARRLPPQR
jgi:DNA-binding MarR family transcriptional regulator